MVVHQESHQSLVPLANLGGMMEDGEADVMETGGGLVRYLNSVRASLGELGMACLDGLVMLPAVPHSF